ncbi:two-partner secretion domain-containing protein [Curvibacter delicatus]|uniref:two-partner secretion domain-containing protein n=1 Tax=Curvibacter delicatus TaxID=80879 RepID=UPI001470A0B7|nr:filamentous hemagglutinin N-terminal domain-containing protein [Curvibacter delicatus]
MAGLPTGGTVAAGTVSSQLTSSQLTLTQSTQRAVLDWQSFNIDAGKTVQFIQPDVSSAVLNRVAASANMSQIYGSMTANGTVVLMNPNGVYFHQGANINVGSLIVTTGRIDQSQFMAEGPITIDAAISGSITNEGSITAENAGLVALVAPSVVNKGAIIATGGRIALSGADRATVSLNSGLYEFAVPAGAQGTNATISNMAGARLEGKTILLSTGDAANLVSGVINLQGVQQASSAIVVDGDTVVLKSDLDAPSIAGNSNTIQVHDTASILDALQIAKTGTAGAGATVELQAGTFNQQVKLNKANMTLRGVDNAKIVVPNSATKGVEVLANNVTVQGLEIEGPLTAPYSSLTTDQWNATPASVGIFVDQNVTGFNITGNNIHDVRTGIRVFGTGNVGSITNNEIENTKGGILFQYTNGTGVTMTGNREGSIGNEWGIGLNINSANSNTGDAPTEWQASLLALANANNQMAVEDRKYATSNRTRVIVDDDSTVTAVDDFNLGNGLGNARQPLKTIQSGINAVVKGGTVQVRAGTYTVASTLNVNKSVTLDGAGEAQTLIDARGVTGNYGMYVTADDVTLSGFSLYGPSNDVGTAYGIKVSPGGSADARLRNFTIRNVTSRGAGRAELDLNGVDGALIDNVTLNGARVSDGVETKGAGLQLTDSANVRVRNTTSLNNIWGGLAIYQANTYYNQQVNNITVEGNNHFNELNPVYLQDQSASKDFGALSIAGFDYAVRNATANTDSSQYTWLQATKQKAYDFAVNSSSANPSYSASAGYIQGWNGSTTTQNFEVGVGNLAGGGTRAMSINTAVNQADSGAQVNVAAGTYAESVNITKALTLDGAGAGQSILDPTSGNAVTVSGNIGANSTVVIDGFTFRDAPTAGVSVESNTVLGQLTVQNSEFRGNGVFGFTANGSATAGIPGLANVSLLNSTFEGNGAPSANATSLGQGDIHFNYYNGNATLKDLTITGNTEHTGIHFRGYHNASTNAVYDAGTWVFDNITLAGSFLRPSGSAGTWNPGGPGHAIHLFEYGSMANVSFNNVRLNQTVGHGMFLEGLSSTLNIGNTTFGVPDRTVTGTGTSPTYSMNIVSGANSQNNVKTNVDATHAIFTGASNGFDIEDRVGHALDVSGLGLVTWNTGNVYVTQSSGSIQRGVDAAAIGSTINVGTGSYTEQVSMNKANQTLKGVDGAKLEVPDLSVVNGVDAITIKANNVTVEGMEIAGPINAPYYDYYATSKPNVSRGIVVKSGATGFTLRNNNIHDVRTGILIDGNNGTGNTVSGNRIENTKSGISVQYTGGAGIAIENNREGDVGNEWGLNLNLNKYSSSTEHLKEDAPTLAWQQHLLDLSAANRSWKVQDQAYKSANRTHVTVAKTPVEDRNQGSVLTPINTIQGGVNAVVRGGKVDVKSDTYAESVTVDRLMNLSFNDVTLRSLSLTSGAAGSGIGGKLTASGAGGLVFDGGIKLLADTTLATEGRDITLRGAVQNNATTAFGLTLATNAGNGSNRGDVTLRSGGADGNALGQLNVTARNFTLDNTLWVRGYAIDARGDVALSNSTLKATAAGVTSSLTASGNVTGSTTSAGAVVLNSDGNVAANVTAGGTATVSGRNVSGTISGSSVTATAQQMLDAAVTAGGGATLNGREIRGSVTAGTLTARADTTMNLALNVISANLNAGGRADLSGRAGNVVVEAKQSYFSGSFPAVESKGTGTTFINGVPQRDEDTVPASVVIVRPPIIVLPPPPPTFVVTTQAPAPVMPTSSVGLSSQPATAAGGSGSAGGTSGGTSPAATGGSGSSGGSGNGTGASSSGGGNGSTASGSSSGESGGGSSGSGSGSSTSNGSNGSSSGGASGGGSGGGSGGAAVAAGGAPRPLTVTRNAPGKAAGESLDRGQGVEVDLSPGRS